MTDFALVCRTYAGQTNWYFIPRITNRHMTDYTLELEFGAMPDGTNYYVQQGRLQELFQPEHIEILAALRKLIHDVPEGDDPWPPIREARNVVEPPVAGWETLSDEDHCGNPECCPPIDELTRPPSVFDEWETA